MIFRHLALRTPLFIRGCACLLSVLLFISCSSSDANTATRTPRTPPITPTAPAGIKLVTPTIVTSLAPVSKPLAPPPKNCPIKPPPQQKHLDTLGMNENVTLLGGGIFWFYGMFYSPVLYLGHNGSNEFDSARWPATKWVVEVGPNTSQPVTLRLQEMRTKALAWWIDAQTPPQAATQTLILDPATDTENVGSIPGVPDVPHGSPGTGWSEWGVFPLFPIAGCYSLQVNWSGGSWQSVMAVGD